MANKVKVGLIGAGRTGTALLKEFLKYTYVEIIAVADINEKAQGIKLAVSKGIFTTTKPMDLVKRSADIDILIEVSGDMKLTPRTTAMRRAVAREAGNLADKGKPFRKLRQYRHWDGQELPEIAPAHSAAFWQEVAVELGPGGRRVPGLDLGVAWSREEARSLAVGDVLGAFRDLAPLYKLLANAE